MFNRALGEEWINIYTHCLVGTSPWKFHCFLREGTTETYPNCNIRDQLQGIC